MSTHAIAVSGPPRHRSDGPYPWLRLRERIFTALQEQLGLKLESTRGNMEFLVIDSVEHPTDN